MRILDGGVERVRVNEEVDSRVKGRRGEEDILEEERERRNVEEKDRR